MSDHSIGKSGKRFSLISRECLDSIPDPSWLIDGVIPAMSLSVIYGEPGCGKSFLALDMALSVASGFPWHNRAIEQGVVIYIYAEGVYGLKSRVSVWEKNKKKDRVQDIHFIANAPDLTSTEDVKLLLDTIQKNLINKVSLIIIDTLARAIPQADENSSKDIGLVIQHCDQIKEHLGANVILIHHSGKSAVASRTERGSSSLRGAVDTSIQVIKKQNILTVKCMKQKDSAPFDEMQFRLTKSISSSGFSSCYLAPVPVNDKSDIAILIHLRSINVQKLLALMSSEPQSEFSWGELKQNSDVPVGSLDRTLKQMTLNGLTVKSEQNTYKLTEKAITIISQSDSHHDGVHYQPSPLSHPFRGDSDEGDTWNTI